jgi:hypothetical protein
MRSLTWFLDTARARAGSPSDAELSRRLELESAAVRQYRARRAFPSDDVMLKLAALCDVSPEEALCELNVWRAEHAQHSERAAVYKRLLAKAVAGSVLALGLVCGGPGQSGNASAWAFSRVHIMR